MNTATERIMKTKEKIAKLKEQIRRKAATAGIILATSVTMASCSPKQAQQSEENTDKQLLTKTLAPALNKRLTTTLILDAFPGIGLDEKTTVSPGLILTNLCVPLAIRLNAAKASP